MSNVTIRRASEQDADAILQLWREMMEVHHEIEPMAWTLPPDADDHFRSHLSDLLADSDHLVLVATRDEHVLGYLVAGKAKRPPVLEPPAEGLIEGCCVTRAARRMGVGRRLVAEAMDWFRGQGLTLARTSCALGNAASVPFWKAQGFRPYQVTGARPVDLTQAAARASFDAEGPYFGSLAETYDRLQPVFAGRAYGEGLAMVVDLVPHDSHDAFAFIELGCGTATLARSVLDRFPASRGIAVDEEPAMLAVARRKLASYGDRAEVQEADIVACDLPTCDLVLAAHVLHHVSPEDLARLLRRIARALRPGGCLVVLDGMMTGPQWGQRVSAQGRRIHDRHVAAAIAAGQTTQKEMDARAAFRQKMKDEGKDIEYRRSAEQLAEMMRTAGFDEVGLVWQMFARTILMGFVPERDA